MKKFAFTLMELLTAMAIIGITAALVAPALTNIMPDKTKMQVIKAYKVLADTTQDLLNDPSLYRNEKCNSFDAYEEVVCYGLAYAEMPKIEPYNNVKYTEYGKYPMLLSSKMELAEDVEYNDSGHEVIFTTLDGVKWSIIDITDGHIYSGGNQAGYAVEYQVTIDLNGEKGPNSLGSKNVKKPDRFMFHVDTYGKVTAHPEDKLTAQYLKTRTKFNNKKEDYKAAFGS